MKEKPDVLNDEDVARWMQGKFGKIVAYTRSREREAQRDADVAYYEPLLEQAQQEIDYIAIQQKALEGKLDDVELAIQQAKTEVAREILRMLDELFEQRAFVEYHILFDTFRQQVQSKYLEVKK